MLPKYKAGKEKSQVSSPHLQARKFKSSHSTNGLKCNTGHYSITELARLVKSQHLAAVVNPANCRLIFSVINI